MYPCLPVFFTSFPRFCVSYQIRVLRFPLRKTLLLSYEDWHVDVIANPESHNLLPGSVLLSVICYLYSVLYYLYSVLCTPYSLKPRPVPSWPLPLS